MFSIHILRYVSKFTIAGFCDFIVPVRVWLFVNPRSCARLGYEIPVGTTSVAEDRATVTVLFELAVHVIDVNDDRADVRLASVYQPGVTV